MTSRSGFTPDEAHAAGERIGIDWGSAPFDLEQFRMGMDVDNAAIGRLALAAAGDLIDRSDRLVTPRP